VGINISNVYVQSFENNVRHLAQQSGSRARMCVTEKSVSSEKHNWERIGANTASLKTGPRQATPTNDSDWSRRVSVAATYDIGDTSEQEDPIQMLVDPNSNIVRSVGMAMRRQVDDVIFASATGTALDGTGAAIAFPAGQTVGTGAASFTYDGVTEVYEKFMVNDIDPDEQKYMIIGPTQLRKMQQLTEYTSSDYVNIKALANKGFVESWMGFDWIVSNRLLIPVAGQISCLALTKQAIGLQMNRDITTRVAEDPSISFAWRIYAYMTLGAVRVEDEHIVHWHLLNTL
jgi:capsid protein